MSTFNLTPAQLAERLKRHADFIPKSIQAGTSVAAQRGVALLKRKSNAHVYEGHFKNAWRAMSDLSSKEVTVINDSPIAGIIERGARPHGVNEEGRDALREWIRKTLVRRIAMVGPGRGKQGPARRVEKMLTRSQAEDDPEVEQVLQAILHKLATVGQPGNFIVRDSLEELGKFVVIEVVGQLKRLIDEDATP